MKLTKLLERVEYECINGSVDVEVADLVNDSRKAKEGSLFFCIKGAVSDGHKYAADVIAKGAKVLVVQNEVEGCDGDQSGGQPLCDGNDLSSIF